ncbi:hypothetical protein A8C75_06020 [Marinobacterium aestuarii]|uniref:Uncharacterized protein n=1 Tax=Marinobacterium aestuarii TaxID=1821621 RepID=A0A1A9EWT6_9GAMM|nr:hypothetical protein [Marinobacterium aestuarii]ANG62091.1 hypothetical protein A8C75_06020 [Marinobacterium aestuarii]
MSRSQEFDIPDLGPAREGAAPGRGQAEPPPRRAAPVPPPPAKGGNLLHSLVLVLLTAAASGLGYWGYGLQQQLNDSLEQQAQAAQRLTDLEQLLEVTSDSASQSGQTLSGRLEQQGKTAAEKYQHFDSEIAKLWTIAYQSNKPKLEAQEKLLATQTELQAQQSKQLEVQAAQLTQLAPLAEQFKAQAAQQQSQTVQLESQAAQLQSQVAQLESLATEVKSLQAGLAASDKARVATDKQLVALAGLEKGQASLKGDLDKTVQELRRSLATLETQVRISEEVQSEKVVAQQQALRKLSDKVATLEAGAGNTDVSRRVRVNEQAIQAIDGSRRQLNQELLQMRQQLNNLQLRLQ